MQKGGEAIRDALMQAAKGRVDTPMHDCTSHSDGDGTSEGGAGSDSPLASPSGIWPSNAFISQYSMLGTNGLVGLQKALEVVLFSISLYRLMFIRDILPYFYSVFYYQFSSTDK